MSTLITYNELVDLLEKFYLPKSEVWMLNYIPSGAVYKIVLKDALSISNLKGYLPGTEEIYIMSAKDFSMETSLILHNANIPVFGTDGERLL